MLRSIRVRSFPPRTRLRVGWLVFSLSLLAALGIGPVASAQPLPPAGTPPPPGPRNAEPTPDPLAHVGPQKQDWLFGIEARSPILKGEPASFNPAMGLGIGAHAARLLRPWFRLRFTMDHDRIFSRANLGVPGLGGITVSRSQDLTSTAFLVQAVFRLPYKWFAAHLSLGTGLWIAFFNNAEVEEAKKIDRTALLPGARIETGVSFRLHHKVELGAAFGYDIRRDWTRVPTSSNPGAPLRRVFDDQMFLALRLDYRF